MQQILTVACKLVLTPEIAPEIDATLLAFSQACDYINQSVPQQITSRLRIHHLAYQSVRQLFGLSANLACRAIARVAANRKTALQKGTAVESFAPTSADYDARIFTFFEQQSAVTITLINGRKKFQLLIGDYQRSLLKGQKPTSAQLVKRKDSTYYINIQVKNEKQKVEPDIDTLGVDLGRKDIAHTSKGQSYSGEKVQKVRDHFAKQRLSLQKKATKGTRSTRRRSREKQKRLSGKERRFQRWLNHQISLQIVLFALTHNLTIVLEDLTGIRERTNKQPRSKVERRRANSWAFYQLRQFIIYKAIKYGVAVMLVEPAYSSQGCHKCFHIGTRKGK